VPPKDALHRVEEGLIALLLAAMTALTFLQVVLRAVFNSGLSWAFEAATVMFGWLVLIGLSYGVRARAHIGIDVVVRMLPRRPRRFVGIVAVTLALLYACLMFFGSSVSIDRLMILGVDAQDIPVRRWILGICLPLGFALLIVRLVEMGWRIVSGQSGGYELSGDAADAAADNRAGKAANGAGGRR
jgi:C4-dicarboxylate transporter DctQ subunit